MKKISIILIYFCYLFTEIQGVAVIKTNNELDFRMYLSIFVTVAIITILIIAFWLIERKLFHRKLAVEPQNPAMKNVFII